MMEKMKLLIAESTCENIHTNSKQYEDIPEDAVSIPGIAENSEKLQESVQECNDYFILEDVSPPNVVNELRENEIDSLYFMAHHEDFSQDNQIQTQGIIKKCKRSLNFTMSENEHIGESITDVDVPIALEENIQVETEHPNLLTDTLTVGKDITLSEDILVGEGSSVASTDNTYSPQSSSSDSNHSILSLKNLRVKKALDFNTLSNENGKGHNSDLNKNFPNIDATDNEEVNNVILLQNVPTCTGSLNINVESGHVQMNLENTLHAGVHGDYVYKSCEYSFHGIIIQHNIAELSNHKCVGYVDTAGLFTLYLSNLKYDFKMNNCLHAGLYEGTAYRMETNNTLVANMKRVNKENVQLDHIIIPPSSNTNAKNSPTNQNEINAKSGGKKKHFCIFCKKLIFAIGRHILTQHKTESAVKDICDMPVNSKERRKALYRLRCEGMNYYNDSRTAGADMIVVRNPAKSSSSSFLPCHNCKGRFLPRNLARHERKCVGRVANRTRVVSLASQLARPVMFSSVEDKLVHRLLKDLNNDAISDIVKSDKVLLLLAKNIAIKYAKHIHRTAPCRQKLRELARFVMEVRKIDEEVTDLASCLVPKKYDICKLAIQHLCVLDENYSYLKPSLASHLRASLIDAVEVLKIQNIKDGLQNSSHQEDLDNFLTIHMKEYSIHIGKNANSTLCENNWNKNSMLPTVEDVRCFQQYLTNNADSAFHVLNVEGFNYTHWLKLGKCVMLQLLTFNRRRVGEVSRILLANFHNRQKIEKEQYKTLTRLECILANNYERMEIRGKRGRRVPLLLNRTHVKLIEMFIKFRTDAGVAETNPYLFGVSHKTPYIQAVNVVREYSILCGASNPKKIRGTYLRKQIATLSQMLNLNDNEIQQLADFMGHEVSIHRAHYRTPELTLQVTRLAKFFMAVGDDNVEKYRGKSLEELRLLGDKEEVRDLSDSDCCTEDNVDSVTTKSSDEISETEGIINNTPSKLSCLSNNTLRSPTRRTPKKLRRYNNLNIKTPLKSPVRRNVAFRNRWSQEEVNILKEEFQTNLQNCTLPPISSCLAVLRRNANVFKSRTKFHIYAWINNKNKQTRRKKS